MTHPTRLVVGGLLILFVLLALLQLRPERPRPPSITDRLVQLNRQLLIDSNPVGVAQAAMCETTRLYDVLGPVAAPESVEAANRRSYSRNDALARERVDRVLAGRIFVAGGKTCDSINRAASNFKGDSTR